MSHTSSPLDEFRAGAVMILPAVVAALPFGLILGATAATKGLSPVEMLLMSGLVFAGGSQFLAVDLWTSPTPWLALGFAALLINLRHVLMGVSLGGKLSRFTPWQKALAVFVMADETWAMAERRALDRPLTPAFYAGMGVLLYVAWLSITVLGAVIGAVLPDPKSIGFDFAFTAIFIGLVAGFPRNRATLWVALASGAVAALVQRSVSGPWYVIAGAAAGVLVAGVLAPADSEAAQAAEERA